MKEMCGDVRLDIKNRIAYIIINFLRGIYGYSPFFKTEYYHPDCIDKDCASPGRKYLNNFIYYVLSEMIDINKCRILDVCCGNGYIRNILSDIKFKGTYTGLDKSKHKDYDNQQVSGFETELIICDIEEYKTDRRFDLIISNTVLEHVENDFLALSVCDTLLEPDGLQIHVVPSTWSLFLYVWHGYRQYAPRRIKQMFKGKEYKVKRIGGFFSFLLHMICITIPGIIFKTEYFIRTGVYRFLVIICNKLDNVFRFCSSLYIIIVGKNYDIAV